MFESNSLENFWKRIAGKCLKASWKQIAGKFLKAKRWQNFESSGILFLQWLRYASDEFLCICARKSWALLMKASHIEKYIDAGQKKNCYFADSLPVYLLITVKTNARGSQMLQTNRVIRSDCRCRSHTTFGGWKKPSHYWRGSLNLTNCETILKASDSYSVARLPEQCFTEYTKTRVIYKI